MIRKSVMEIDFIKSQNMYKHYLAELETSEGRKKILQEIKDAKHKAYIQTHGQPNMP